MAVAEFLLMAPFAFSLGWLLESPFAKYVVPLVKAFGKEF